MTGNTVMALWGVWLVACFAWLVWRTSDERLLR